MDQKKGTEHRLRMNIKGRNHDKTATNNMMVKDTPRRIFNREVD